MQLRRLAGRRESVPTRQILTTTAAARRDTLGAWETRAAPELQRAAKAFLLRLVAENGGEEAAAILHRLADELEGLPELYADEGDPAPTGRRTRMRWEGAGEALGASAVMRSRLRLHPPIWSACRHGRAHL